MGRKDSFTASKSLANNNIPGPNSTVANLVSKFQNVNLSLRDMVVLSGTLKLSIFLFLSNVLDKRGKFIKENRTKERRDMKA